MTTVDPSLTTAQLPGLLEREDELALAETLLETYARPGAVEWHLGNTYRKLDIRGRNALAKALTPEPRSPL